MSLRIWFTAEDLARTRIVPADPFGETLFSVIALRANGGMSPLEPWRRRTLARLTDRMRPLAGMWPGTGPNLDLLTLVRPTGDMEEALDRLIETPRQEFDVEVEHFVRAHGQVPWALRPLLHHDRRSRLELTTALREYHEVAVRPYWPRLHGHVERQRAGAGREVAGHGFDRLFARLGRHVRWRAPVLEVPSSLGVGGPPKDKHLGGRGLMLVPSVFFGPMPHFYQDLTGRSPDLLVYDAMGGADGLLAPEADRDLAELIGPTRSQLLRAIAERGGSTTQLAKRTGVSMASVSEHAAVLRRAGLIATVRTGRSVEHSMTELGRHLLNGAG